MATSSLAQCPRPGQPLQPSASCKLAAVACCLPPNLVRWASLVNGPAWSQPSRYLPQTVSACGWAKDKFPSLNCFPSKFRRPLITLIDTLLAGLHACLPIAVFCQKWPACIECLISVAFPCSKPCSNAATPIIAPAAVHHTGLQHERCDCTRDCSLFIHEIPSWPDTKCPRHCHPSLRREADAPGQRKRAEVERLGGQDRLPL